MKDPDFAPFRIRYPHAENRHKFTIGQIPIGKMRSFQRVGCKVEIKKKILKRFLYSPILEWEQQRKTELQSNQMTVKLESKLPNTFCINLIWFLLLVIWCLKIDLPSSADKSSLSSSGDGMSTRGCDGRPAWAILLLKNSTPYAMISDGCSIKNWMENSSRVSRRQSGIGTRGLLVCWFAIMLMFDLTGASWMYVVVVTGW